MKQKTMLGNHMTRKGDWPPADSQQKNEASIQLPARKQMLLTSMWVENGSFPNPASDETAAPAIHLDGSLVENLTKLCPDS